MIYVNLRKKRLENIKRNESVLFQLGVKTYISMHMYNHKQTTSVFFILL